MTGRSSRSAGKAPAANPPEASQTREGSSSQEGRQGEQVGVVPDPGATNLYNDNLDVTAPMGLIQMRQIIDNEALSMEQIQVLGKRIRELERARAGTSRRRSRDSDDSDSDRDRSRKRRADHDLKYDAIKELKLGATLKLWTNWKLEINRAFDGAPYKYDNDRTKVIKALIHLHDDCKTLWNNHLRRHPSEEYDWKAFSTWVEKTIRDHGNFEDNTYAEWIKARQGPDQNPWSFDAYLTSLEVELEPQTESTRARDFLHKLQPSLYRAIKMSGLNPLPQIRQEMVSLATRMWDEMKKEAPKEAILPAEKLALQNNGANRGQRAQEKGQRAQEKGQATDKKADNSKEQGSDRRRWPKEFGSGKNDKGESICYKCGSTKHLSFDHDKEAPKEAANKTKAETKEVPIVDTIIASGHKKDHNGRAEQVWDLTDSEDEDD